jgi:hypothetical protein
MVSIALQEKGISWCVADNFQKTVHIEIWSRWEC